MGSKGRYLLFLLVIITASCLGGCRAVPEKGAAEYKVVCSNYPAYDWIMQIVKGREDRFDIRLLTENGIDMHSFQPSVEDMAHIATADLAVYVGGTSDAWIHQAIVNSGRDDILEVNMMEAVVDRVLEEEIIEGMEAEEGSDAELLGNTGDGQGKQTEAGTGDIEYDEHVWLSLTNAGLICRALTDMLCRMDPSGAETYLGNEKEYQKSISGLDAYFRERLAGASGNTLIFGGRFPFAYFCHDYGLDYYAAFPGCSADTNASFETVVFLAGKVDEKQPGAVFVIDHDSSKIAETILENSMDRDTEIKRLYSMQAAGRKEEEKEYLECMKENMDSILEALN